MNSSEDQFILSVAERGRRTAEGAAFVTQQSAPPGTIRLGRIVSGASGSYTVDVLAADLTTAYTIPGVRPHGSASFNTGDEVFLIWIGDRPIPHIFSGGGGAGLVSATGCFAEFTS